MGHTGMLIPTGHGTYNRQAHFLCYGSSPEQCSVSGGPEMLWRQPGVKQVAEVDHEGKRIPDEITEELHISIICARHQGGWR